MEGVFARIVVINHNLHDLALLQHKGACIAPIYGRVGGEGTSAECGVEGGDLGGFVRYIVEKGAERREEKERKGLGVKVKPNLWILNHFAEGVRTSLLHRPSYP